MFPLYIGLSDCLRVLCISISLIVWCYSQHTDTQHTNQTCFQQLKVGNKVFVPLLKTHNKLLPVRRDKSFSVYWMSAFSERETTLASSSLCLCQYGRDKRHTDQQTERQIVNRGRVGVFGHVFFILGGRQTGKCKDSNSSVGASKWQRRCGISRLLHVI